MCKKADFLSGMARNCSCFRVVFCGSYGSIWDSIRIDPWLNHIDQAFDLCFLNEEYAYLARNLIGFNRHFLCLDTLRHVESF